MAIGRTATISSSVRLIAPAIPRPVKQFLDDRSLSPTDFLRMTRQGATVDQIRSMSRPQPSVSKAVTSDTKRLPGASSPDAALAVKEPEKATQPVFLPCFMPEPDRESRKEIINGIIIGVVVFLILSALKG